MKTGWLASLLSTLKETVVGDADRLSFPNLVLIADLREHPHSIFLSFQNYSTISLLILYLTWTSCTRVHVKPINRSGRHINFYQDKNDIFKF